ncbi:MAG: endonuclease [Deferribacteraceae bacterium]|jgi:5-methylcytosine-specific restriction endonuclease McrA|nr:endonuclease [Deferribacteraceae bacterium]
MFVNSFFISDIPESEIKKEKEKARALRKKQWWKNQISQGICHYCGRKFSPEELTMDHIVPLIRGGKTTKGNVVPACKECNNKKKYMLPIEWAEYLENLKNK